MSVCVIADLHLSETRTDLTSAFESFCKKMLNKGDTLIIAGDFFDFYVGVNLKGQLHTKVKNIISSLKARGIDAMFLHGNRDFLIDGKASAFFGFKLVDDTFTIDTPSGRVLIIHGDELCTKDKAFCRFRKLSRSKSLQALFKCLPFAFRNKIGAAIRGKSERQDENRHMHPEEYGLVRPVACKLLKKVKAKILIHGHFHVFGSENDFCGKKIRRLGLGCWGRSCSCVIINDAGIKLMQFKASELND